MNSHIRTASVRWALKLGAALLVGPVVAGMLSGLTAPDGGSGHTLLVSEAPVMGLILGVAAVVLAGIYGFITLKLSTLRLAIFNMGVILAWAAAAEGRLNAIARHTSDAGVMNRLGIEALILSIVAVAFVWLLIRFGGKHAAEERALKADSRIPAAMATVLLAGGAAAFIMARTDAFGQTLGAAIAAGIAGITLARIVAHTCPLIHLVVAACALAVVSPVAAGVLSGNEFRAAVYSGEILALGRIMPFDWIAGLLIGAPVGTLWAHSFTEKHAEESPESAAA